MWRAYTEGRHGAAETSSLEAAGRLIERSSIVVDDTVKR